MQDSVAPNEPKGHFPNVLHAWWPSKLVNLCYPVLNCFFFCNHKVLLVLVALGSWEGPSLAISQRFVLQTIVGSSCPNTRIFACFEVVEGFGEEGFYGFINSLAYSTHHGGLGGDGCSSTPGERGKGSFMFWVVTR